MGNTVARRRPGEWRDYVPHFGVDYDLLRFSKGNTDRAGNLVWHERLPHNNEWQRITIVTIDLRPEDATDTEPGMARNFMVNPASPLNIYNSFNSADPRSRFYYDLDDLVGDEMDRYGLEF